MTLFSIVALFCSCEDYKLYRIPVRLIFKECLNTLKSHKYLIVPVVSDFFVG